MGILKQLPFTSGRYTIGWQSCATYAGHLLACSHRASLTITQGVRQNVTKNVWSMKGPWKPLRKRSLTDKSKCPSCMVQTLPRSHKEWNVALHLTSSQAGECNLVHSLDHSRSSQTDFWASLHLGRWTVICLLYCTMVLTSSNHQLFYLMFLCYS